MSGVTEGNVHAAARGRGLRDDGGPAHPVKELIQKQVSEEDPREEK